MREMIQTDSFQLGSVMKLLMIYLIYKLLIIMSKLLLINFKKLRNKFQQMRNNRIFNKHKIKFPKIIKGDY